ncbi:DEAD/DEAH box helicase [Shewanella dokdonensis]|uniref:DNA 3'-5' helicase n=1 Tax=Shewanella dokdonensis TaxID=712036 RepID=A0ABX8DK09_9GAMM|nr:DEAD/DEAH box helicase [Shewanella dokdonensis]MCL1075792.1 DEAD/DEAH box helicase [Shewanella dokdonensis]QVK24142.1 DEAD/DEAH box helicase [Shewanella dokdonensis]
MSDSKLSNNHSNSSTSGLDETNIFEEFVPSKIFDITRNNKYPLVQPELNRKIAKLTNPKTLNYTTNIAKIMSVLRDREIVEYQQTLMEAAIHNISEDTVDIDFIRIGLNLSSTDIYKLLDGENGLIRVRTQNRQDRLIVKNMNIGNKNVGYKKSDKRPYFTHRFQMFADLDEYRYLDIYIADPEFERNKGRDLKYNCEIEYIPTRVSRELASFMLYQLQSVLEIRRYKQLIDNALLLELHTGYIMYGVSQLFGFLLTKNNKVKVGEVFPKEGDMAAETTYVGSRASDHLIGYDKVLKENKKFIEAAVLGWDLIAKRLDGIEDWFPNQVCSLRLESRRRFEKDPFKLADISLVRSLLEDVRLIRPKRLFDLDDSELEALVIDKTVRNCRNTLETLRLKNQERREQGKRGRSSRFLLGKRKIAASVSRRSEMLLEAIRTPVKELTDVTGNYSAAKCKVSELLQSRINKIASKSHKISAIIDAEERAIYVEGCPGSGKTSLVVKRVEHLLAEGIDASEISVLAFTNAAAKEFAERLDEKLPDNNSMFIGTFSSWCNKLLNFEKDQKVLSAEAALKIIEDLVRSKSKIVKRLDSGEVARRCQLIFNHQANFDEPILERSIKKVAPELVEYAEDISELLERYKDYKEGKFRDFNDLLVQLRQRLRDDDFCLRVAEQTKHLIIDEIQDTNEIQWDIIEMLYHHGIQFFCVGDPAQSMYGFRGAKHEYLDQFTKTFNNRKRFQLTKNYRSSAPLVSLANEIRRKINSKYSISVSVNKSEEADIPRLKNCDRLKEAAQWLVRDIKARQSSGTQFILCRYNKQVLSVEKALKKADIEYGDGESIQVLTYHKCKGLEAEHCYVLDPQFSKSKLSSYKEELCNAYVALTRAEKTLTILACTSGSSVYGKDDETVKRSGRSIFLDLPEDKLEYID